MRLGTKILLLTLAITLGLAGVIVYVVSRDITEHESARAQADIENAVSDYFARIDALHELRARVVELVVGESQNRAQLEALAAGDVPAREHFKLLLAQDLPRAIKEEVPAAFHVVLDFEGKPIFSHAPEDPRLEGAVARPGAVAWPIEDLLADEPKLTRRYVWVNGRLYLALGMSLKLDASAPPSHAYFMGYLIDSAWASLFLGDRRGAAADAADRTPLHAWFVADGEVVARWVSRKDVDPARDADALGAARDVAPKAAAGPLDRPEPINLDAAGERFIGEAVAFDLPGGRRGAVVVASSLTQALVPLRHLQWTIAFVTAGVVALAVVLFRFVSNFIAGPVRLLVAGTRRVARGEFDEPIVVRRSDELGELADSFNEMSLGLQQRDLVKSTFGKFVDPKVVEGFLADPSRLMPGGEKRVQSVMFSDLRGFTATSERLDPDDLVALLNGHLGDAADIVTEARGIVDKFIGDAVVAFWGPPITGEDEHAGLACTAALRIVRAVRRLDEECARLGVPPLGVRVGVATGPVLVGIIGSANKYNYTVMGDTANLASRLEGLNKLYRTGVLVSERTAREAGAAVLTRRVDRVRVIGRAEAVDLYEVLAERGEEDGVLPLRCEAYAEAMALYQRRAWDNAAAAFDRMTREWPDDGPARAMAERCARFVNAEPNTDWDGVWTATSK